MPVRQQILYTAGTALVQKARKRGTLAAWTKKGTRVGERARRTSPPNKRNRGRQGSSKNHRRRCEKERRAGRQQITKTSKRQTGNILVKTHLTVPLSLGASIVWTAKGGKSPSATQPFVWTKCVQVRLQCPRCCC